MKVKNIRIHNRPAYNSEVHATRDMGVGELNNCYEDAELADTIVAVGTNALETQTNYFLNHWVPNLRGTSMDKKKAEFGSEPVEKARIVIVDPRRTVTVNACEVEAGKDNVMHLAMNSGTDLALFNAWMTYIADKGWTDKAFIDASTTDFDKMRAANKVSLEDAAKHHRADGRPDPQIGRMDRAAQGGQARRRTMFAYEKGLIWGNDNYRTNGALVNVALATGNVGRPGGGCVRMGGHQEGYSRPSDAHVGRPAAYVDKLLIEGKGGVHHIWGCDHYKTTLNAFKFKQNYKKRTDMVKDAMMTAPYGDRDAMVKAIVDAIKKGGLFAVDVDIVPTKIGEACHVWLPAATSGEANLTSMNGERRMRLTEKYMDPPGQAMPDSLIAARIANNMERVLREQGKGQYADQFKGFDWKTEEDAFMDGYHNHEKGGQFVTYERLRAMGTNGFQEPATAFKDGKIVGTKRLFADGKFGTKDGKAKFMETQWRGLQAPGKEDETQEVAVPHQQRPRQHRLAERLSRSGQRVRHGPLAVPVHPDEPEGHDGPEAEAGRSRRGLQRQRLDPGDGLSDADGEAEADLHAVRLSDRRAGQRGLGGGERVHHPELQADLGHDPQDRGCSGGREASQLQVARIHRLTSPPLSTSAGRFRRPAITGNRPGAQNVPTYRQSPDPRGLQCPLFRSHLLDHGRLDAALADHGERVAGGAAV